MYLPCTNSAAVLLSICCKSHTTCPWLSLSVLLSINSQQSVFELEHFTAVTFGLTEGKTPFCLEIVSTGLSLRSQTMTVHRVLEVLQVNLASSPRTTVRLAGVRVICVLTDKDIFQSNIYHFNMHSIFNKRI